MLGKPFVYKALFPVIALVLSIAYLPMSLLHWAAPGWEQLARAQEFVGILAKGAWHEPSCKKPQNPAFQPGDEQFLWDPGDCWTLGFAKKNLTDAPEVREGLAAGRFLVAGDNSIPAKSIFDDMFARAVYLDDNTGRGGILYASVDCLGLRVWQQFIPVAQAVAGDFPGISLVGFDAAKLVVSEILDELWANRADV